MGRCAVARADCDDPRPESRDLGCRGSTPSSRIKASVWGASALPGCCMSSVWRAAIIAGVAGPPVAIPIAQPSPDWIDRDFSTDTPDHRGRRHQVRANAARIPLSDGDRGCVQPPRGRLGNGRASAHRIDVAGTELGDWAVRPEGVIHHTDQGSPYTAIAFGQR